MSCETVHVGPVFDMLAHCFFTYNFKGDSFHGDG